MHQLRLDGRRSVHHIGLLLCLLALMNWTSLTAFPASSALVQNISPESSRPGRNGKVAYASDEAGAYDIYLANQDGSGKIRLTAGQGNNLDPTFSPSGLKIAFVSDRDGNYEIYVMNLDGSGQTRLTNNDSDEFDVSWSPDGSKIAFTSERDGNDEVYVMNADGSGQTNLTNNRADDAFPTWSPDSARLAFSSDRSGNADIFVMNADGSNTVNLSNNPANDDFPAWSPNGQRIAFSSDRDGTFDIFLMSTDGSSQVKLSGAGREETFPAWSPDSTRLAFMTSDLTDAGFVNSNIIAINVGGNTNNATVVAAAGDAVTPDWQSLSVASGPFANQIDDPRVFVRQHYLDFLGREPDQGGLDYWTSQITRCGEDERCVNEQRINVSAAFFVEAEFQQIGSFIIRLYRATLGRRPTFAEFQADRNRLSVSNLEASRAAYLEDFLRRSEFTDKYQTSMSGTQFVDALIKTVKEATGADLSSRRSELINDFNANGSRARVVRLVLDDSRLVSAEYNGAFVLAQYFGYLRRDPEEGGFQFWLNVLNNREPNNYRGMVCSFITSAEYQQRFGSVVTRTNRDCAAIR